MDAERAAAGGEVNDLAEGGVAEVVGREGVLRLGDLLRGTPGGDPGLLLGLCRKAGCGGENESKDFGKLHRWNLSRERGVRMDCCKPTSDG